MGHFKIIELHLSIISEITLNSSLEDEPIWPKEKRTKICAYRRSGTVQPRGARGFKLDLLLSTHTAKLGVFVSYMFC